jgi:hypothetical protein
MIEDLLELHPTPKSLVVVSSDHRVQRAARSRGATFIDSAEWYAERRAAMRASQKTESSAKPGAPTPDELNYWLNQFGEPSKSEEKSQAEEPPSPFPPGYADDVIDEG